MRDSIGSHGVASSANFKQTKQTSTNFEQNSLCFKAPYSMCILYPPKSQVGALYDSFVYKAYTVE